MPDDSFIEQNKLYTSKDIMRLLGLTRTTVARLIRKGVLPAPIYFSTGKQARRYWSRGQIETFIQSFGGNHEEKDRAER